MSSQEASSARAAGARHQEQFSTSDAVKLVLTTAFYTFDIGTDAFTAYRYHTKGDLVYFALTLSFILFAPIFTMTSNVRDYCCSRRKDETVTRKVWTFRILLTVLFPLSVYVRFYDYWTYGWRVERQAGRASLDDVNRMKQERKMLNFIRLREAFLEAAPQLTLHVYIAARNGYASFDAFQIVSMVFSLFSLALTLGSLRDFLQSLFVRPNADGTGAARDAIAGPAEEINETGATSWLGIVLLTMAHSLGIAARCLVFSLSSLVVLLSVISTHVAFFTYLLVKRNMRFLNVSAIWAAPDENSRAQKFTNFTILLLLAVISVFSYTHNERCLGHGHYFLICIAESVLIAVPSMSGEAHEWMAVASFVALALSLLLFFVFFESESRINEWSSALSAKFACCDESNEADETELQPVGDSAAVQ